MNAQIRFPLSPTAPLQSGWFRRPGAWLTAALLATLATGCGGAQTNEEGEGDDGSEAAEAAADDAKAGPTVQVQVVEYEAKTKALVEATEKLDTLGQSLEEQRRRLQVICADYPEHAVCSIQSDFARARELFCDEEDFVKHVDAVVAACHQGTCKQVDDAEIISRTDYMLLTQRLPHSLVTFRAAETKLDKKDKEQVQRFLESIQGGKGYVIIVGRASRDGNWKQNLRLAVDRADATRKMLVEDLGIDAKKVGYITYGNEKMYLTSLDAERLAGKKLSVKQANRSALVFAYPCYKESDK